MKCFHPNPQNHCGNHTKSLHRFFLEHALAAPSLPTLPSRSSHFPHTAN
jgi:hypothetical protein